MLAMDNKINLNFYGLNYQTAVEEKKKNEVKAEEKPVVQPETKNVDAKEVLDAMALTGAQNIAFAGLNTINPKNYLDDASISRIQGSMPVFEKAVENYLNIIEAEFPNLSDAQKQELAYQAVLKGM